MCEKCGIIFLHLAGDRTWRDVRVVEGTGLENRRCGSIRGFESHSLRHIFSKCILYLACRSTQVAEGAPLLRE